MSYKYIKTSNILRMPSVLTFLTWWVVLDHFGAPDWAYGVIYSLLGLGAVVSWVALILGRPVDVLADKQRYERSRLAGGVIQIVTGKILPRPG